jgi:hypothetical protein
MRVKQRRLRNKLLPSMDRQAKNPAPLKTENLLILAAMSDLRRYRTIKNRLWKNNRRAAPIPAVAFRRGHSPRKQAIQ